MLLVEGKLQAIGVGEGPWMVCECGHGSEGMSPGRCTRTGADQRTLRSSALGQETGTLGRLEGCGEGSSGP